MKRKHASIAHIAEYCGLSKSTVSRVLNNQFDNFPIAPKTAEKVRAAAKELGYRPSRLARALTTRRTYLIGVSFPRSPYIRVFDPDESHAQEFQSFGEYTYAVVAHPLFKKYDLVIHWRDDHAARNQPDGADVEDNDELPDQYELQSDLLDGLIYFNPSTNLPSLLETAPTGFPLVVVGHPGQEVIDQYICVDIDNRDMARQAVNHLIHSGRRRLLMAVPLLLKDLYCMRERIAGFRDALSAHGLPFGEESLLYLPHDPQEAMRKVQERVEAVSADGLMCATDELGVRTLEALAACGKAVPQQVAVMGFSNTDACTGIKPSLSSVQVPINRIVYQAADELLSVLENIKPFVPGFRPVDSHLVLRESAP